MGSDEQAAANNQGGSKSEVQKTLGAAIDEMIATLNALAPESRATAARAAFEHFGLTVASPLRNERRDEERVNPPAVVDVRSLKVQKNPSSAQEMACVVAYYLQAVAPQAESKASITTSDLDMYFRQGDYPLPRRMEQVLPDAKKAGYFDAEERGSYKLNAVGYNLVAHTLPRTGEKAKRPRRAPARRAARRSGRSGSKKR